MTFIRVLGKNKKEKGDSFEKLMKKALDGAGYEEFRIGTHKTGREIDIFAKHKATGQPIISECKAHEKPIGSGDMLKFYSIYDLEYRRNDKFVGLFFSLSGFKSTTLAAYDEMTTDVKSRFLLRDGDFILSLLRKAKLVAPDETLEYIITSRIKYPLCEKYLACMEGNIYWVQTILTEDKATHYVVLGPNGEDVPDFLCYEIGSVDRSLGNLKLLNVNAIKRILLVMLDASSKTLEEIVVSANECKETVMLALENLIHDRIIEKINDKFHLQKELITFVDLAKQFLGTEDEARFFLSKYNDEMLNSSLIDYCEQRFKLRFKLEAKEVLLQIIRVSPSALYEILFAPIGTYVTTDEHMRQLNLPIKEREKIKESQNAEFIGKFLRLLIVDLWNPSLKDNLLNRGVRGFRTLIDVRLAGLNRLYVSVSGVNLVMLLRAAGRIEAGQLVSATNFDLYVDTGLISLNLGEPEEALRNFDIALNNLKDPSKLKAAWNNKGLALATLGKFDEAIFCYDEALKIDLMLKEAWYNKGRALALKGEHKKAIENYTKALEIDPNYADASTWMEESRRLLN